MGIPFKSKAEISGGLSFVSNGGGIRWDNNLGLPFVCKTLVSGRTIKEVEAEVSGSIIR